MKRTFLNRRGFSLLEMVATLGILLGISLIISPYAYRHLNSGNLEHTRHTLREGIRSIAQTAVSESTDYRLTFDLTNERYSVYAYESTWVLRSTTNLPKGIQFESTTFPSHEVTFDRFGSASSSGIITLKDQNGKSTAFEVLTTGLIHFL